MEDIMTTLMRKLLILAATFFVLVTLVALPAMAQPGSPPAQQQGGSSPPTGGEIVELPCPLGSSQNCNDPRVIIGNVIKVVLGLVGSLALVLFIYGGVVMMTSAGNSDRVTTGRNTLVWATIGLLVIFSSYTLVGFIIRSITTTSQGTTASSTRTIPPPTDLTETVLERI